MRWLDRLPVLVVAMSLPLFFSELLKNPPAFLQGLPFVVVWTWGVVAAVVLPLLLVVEGGTCAWLLSQRPGERSPLSWHVGALLIAVAAEVIFVMARRSSV